MVINDENSTSASSPLPSIWVDHIKPFELEEVLLKCKNRKHPEMDKIAIEMIKYASIDVKIWFLNLLNNCWQSKYIPENWKEARITPIFEKGDRWKCENYRGLSLLKEGYNIYAKIITARLQKLLKQLYLKNNHDLGKEDHVQIIFLS